MDEQQRDATATGPVMFTAPSPDAGVPAAWSTPEGGVSTDASVDAADRGDVAPPAGLPYAGQYDGPVCAAPPPRSVDIAAVDDEDFVGWTAGAVREQELSGFRNEHELVDRVLATAGERPIGTLDILDHGCSSAQQMGDTQVTVETLQDPALRADLARLRGHFGPEGRVDLQGCEVGQNPELLRDLVRVWGVPVRAGVSSQNPLIPGYEGSVVTCGPGETPDAEPVCTTEEHPYADAAWRLRNRIADAVH